MADKGGSDREGGRGPRPPRGDRPRRGPARTRPGQGRDGKRPGGPPVIAHKGRRGREGGADTLWIYGLHAVRAALANPRRKKKRLLLTETAREKIDDLHGLSPEMVGGEQIDHVVPAGAHQGAALLTEDLAPAPLGAFLQDASPRATLVILDHVTDPQNVGAVFRAALAFGAKAVVMQERKSPPLTGALAKAAAGAADILPHVREVNLTRAIETLKASGFLAVGLGGEGEADIAVTPKDRPLALVLGSEGEGLRRLVAEACDMRARIPIDPRMESLNVAAAAAVALHALRR